MKSINRRFIQQRESNQYAGDYVNLYRAVLGQGFVKPRIIAQFDSLVSKDDYAPEERKELIDFLFQATQKDPLRDRKQG